MKKVITLLVCVAACWLNALAINDMVADMGSKFKNGDLYSISINVPAIREMASEDDTNTVYSDVDLALCSYFEALASQFLMDDVEGKEEKLSFVGRTFGEDHYVTLTVKTIYEKFSPNALRSVDEALAAIEAEHGSDSWQYAAMLNRKAEVMGNNNQLQKATDDIEAYCKSVQGTWLEKHWLTGALHGVRCALLSGLQKWDDMGPDFEVASEIFMNMMNGIGDGSIEPLAICGAAHVGFYVTSVGRSLGENDLTIECSEAIMANLKEMDLDRSGLAYAYKSNMANAYYKKKDYAKSRPMMEEYLRYLESKGEKGTSSYKYIEKLLKETPKPKR